MPIACPSHRFILASPVRSSGTNAQPGGAVPRCNGVRKAPAVLAIFGLICCLLSCSQKPDPNTLVMIIESSPTNLDPRIGLDAQSERIGGLLFDNLLARDEHLSVKPGLADRWGIPDPETYIFP